MVERYRYSRGYRSFSPQEYEQQRAIERRALHFEPPSSSHWFPHEANCDLYYDRATDHFLIRARITAENVQRLRAAMDCMAGIFALRTPAEDNCPFAWAPLDNTWGWP